MLQDSRGDKNSSLTLTLTLTAGNCACATGSRRHGGASADRQPRVGDGRQRTVVSTRISAYQLLRSPARYTRHKTQQNRRRNRRSEAALAHNPLPPRTRQVQGVIV